MTRMPTLRLTQTAMGDGLHRVEISLEVEELARQTADVRFPFRFAEEDQRDLRWYLEDYLQPRRNRRRRSPRGSSGAWPRSAPSSSRRSSRAITGTPATSGHASAATHPVR